MVGPILHHELLLGSRRSRQYVLRWVYAGWLVAQLLFLYFWYFIEYHARTSFMGGQPDTNATGRFTYGFLTTFVCQQLILVALATPILTAGAITEEKTRQTLQYLLTTDLLSWHIVLGKLLGRLANVAILALTGLPVVCFIGLFGGLEPVALFAFAAVTLIQLFLVGSASVLASVWCRTTRDAVIGLYLVLVAAAVLLFGVLQWWFGLDLSFLDPLEPILLAIGRPEAEQLHEVGQRLLWLAASYGLIGVVCLALAVWRLRPAYVRQIEGEGKKKPQRWWRATRAAIPDNPVPWKERQVDGLAPINALRVIPTWLVMLAIFLTTTASSLAILWFFQPPGATLPELVTLAARLDFERLAESIMTTAPSPVVTGLFSLQSILALLISSLVVGIRCSGTISGEREKQTWEALLLTPLTSKQLIGGKMWGILWASYLYLLSYAVPAVLLSGVGGVICLMKTAIWLAGTWLAMYFVGAAGIYSSVRNKTSWQSLLWTIGIGYVGGTIIFLLTSPFIAVLATMIVLALGVIDYYLGTGLGGAALSGFQYWWPAFEIATSLVLAGLFWLLAWFFLSDAQRWVADRERTRHWKEEPRSLRPVRRLAKPRYYR
jgi:ABC-type transport system involved in multi-copper enzyme maturation permease subunit